MLRLSRWLRSYRGDVPERMIESGTLYSFTNSQSFRSQDGLSSSLWADGAAAAGTAKPDNRCSTRTDDRQFPADIRDEFLEGGPEIDLVRSGLEDVMRSTWTRIGDLMTEQPELGDYRTAAYVASIWQIADAYEAIEI